MGSDPLALYLRLIVECDTRARLDDWLARLTAAIENKA